MNTNTKQFVVAIYAFIFIAPLLSANENTKLPQPKTAPNQIVVSIQQIYKLDTAIWGTFNLTKEQIIGYRQTSSYTGKAIILPMEKSVGKLIFDGPKAHIIDIIKDTNTYSIINVKEFEVSKSQRKNRFELADDNENVWNLIKWKVEYFLKQQPKLTLGSYRDYLPYNSTSISKLKISCTRIEDRLSCRSDFTLFEH